MKSKKKLIHGMTKSEKPLDFGSSFALGCLFCCRSWFFALRSGASDSFKYDGGDPMTVCSGGTGPSSSDQVPTLALEHWSKVSVAWSLATSWFMATAAW